MEKKVFMTEFQGLDKKQFRELSQPLQLIKKVTGQSVNELLLEVYEKAVKKETGEAPCRWETYKGWKKEGKTVIKGSKAFKVWSTPKTVTKEVDGEEKENRRFFIANMFCDLQVQDMEE